MKPGTVLLSILKKRGILYLLLLITTVIITLLSDYIIQSKYSYCPHYALTGCECPLCGMIRATRELGRFNLIAAFQYNMGIYLLIFYLIMDFLSFWIRGSSYFTLAKKISLAGLIVGFLTLYAIRIMQFLTRSS
jgi:hypothetical protein